MKRFLLLMILLGSCIAISHPAYAQTNKKTAKKERREALVARGVFETVKGKKIVAVLNLAIPSGETRRAIDDYPFKLINNTLTCNLPFFGSSSQSVWGSEDLAIKAADQPVTPQVSYNKEMGGYEFVFDFKTTNNAYWKCTLKIFADARVNILIEGNRSSIKYEGYLDTEAIGQLFKKEVR